MSIGKLVMGAVVLVVLAAPSFGAAAPVSYSDATGDNPGGADIGVVTADLDPDGRLSIEVSLASIPQLGDEALVFVAFDTDRNPATGSIFGGDSVLLFAFEDRSVGLVRWDGVEYVNATGAVAVLLGSGSMKLRLHPDAIGGSTAFNFVVAATTGPVETGQIDTAPDAGSWAFEGKKAVTVETVDAKFVPTVPKAGTVFQAPVVLITLSDGTTILAPSYRCVAELGSKLVRGTGRGGCTFKLPKSAKGKRLVVTLFVTFKGATEEFEPYVFKVR